MKKLGYVMICGMMLGSTISGLPLTVNAITKEDTATVVSEQTTTQETKSSNEILSSETKIMEETTTESSKETAPVKEQTSQVHLRYGVVKAGVFTELAPETVYEGVVGTAFDLSGEISEKQFEGYELATDALPKLTGTYQEAAQTIDLIYQELPQAASLKAVSLVSYSTLVQGSGWKKGTDGSASGVLKDTNPIQRMKIEVADAALNGNIHYQTRGVDGSWSDYVTGGQESGTGDQGVEAVRIYLDGALAEQYDVWYQTKVKSFGWMKWVKGGAGPTTGTDGASGTAGMSHSINGLKIQLVKKGGQGPKAAATDKKHGYVEATKASYTTRLIGSGNFQGYVSDGKTSGDVTNNKKVEAIKLKVDNTTVSGGIDYRTHVAKKGWQTVAKNDQVSGSTGEKLQVEALKIALTGELKEYFDVYYRSYVQGYGWLGWTSNGEESGTVGLAYGIQGYEVKVQGKGTAAPESDREPSIKKPKIDYQSHVSHIGWQGYKSDGAVSGTTGQKRRVEAIRIKQSGGDLAGAIEYTTHVQNKGWMPYSTENRLSGTTGQSLQVEALKVRLTGALGEYFDVYYRVHVQNVGWLDWAKNDAISGSTGMKYRVEALQVKIVPKDGAAPGNTKRPDIKKPALSYASHVQQIGWQNYRKEGTTSGTTGRALRVEALKMKVDQSGLTGSIQYASHVSKVGWQGYKTNDAVSGTTGRGLSVEAIRVRLTGELAKHFDVYYRVHAQNFGWMGWAKNGANAGTAKYAYRVESVQVRLVRKGEKAPGSTANAFKENLYGTKIAKVQQLLNSKYNSANFGIYVKPIGSDQYAAKNENRQFVAASTGKLPGIYYTQKRINEGSLKINQKLHYSSAVNSFGGAYSPWGAGVLPKSPNYQFYPLSQVLQNTIKYSDNVGANFLGLYGANGYDQTFIKEINRITGRKWSRFILEASARDNARLIEAIYKIGGVSNHFMKDTVFDDQRIPKYLPVPVGHKIGDVYHYRHDVAIVYAKQPYVLSVMTQNNTSYETISIMSKEIYNIMK